MQVFHAEVMRVEDLSVAMRRIVFGGQTLAGYWTTGTGDEYLRILFPAPGLERPRLPIVEGDNLDYSSIEVNRLRTYTVRNFDADNGELVVDFVVHEGGVAAEWARTAQPGQFVGVNTPTGMYDPPEEMKWQILAADYAGLPAAVRIMENTPAQVRTRVVLEVADDSHRIELPNRSNTEVTWVVGGNGLGPSRLEEIVRALPRPDGAGYVWVAGESRVLRGVRRYLRHELGLPATAYKTIGYWIERAEEWNRRFAELDETTKRALYTLWDGDGDPEEIEDEYDAQMTQLGF
jgi:NADPH-dependent ferric siderophore reductase